MNIGLNLKLSKKDPMRVESGDILGVSYYHALKKNVLL